MKLEKYQNLKNRLEEIYESQKQIHVTVKNKRKSIIEAPSRITGIYANFLCVESLVNTYLEKFTISYSDLLTGSIEIKEL